jgi:hypothetical protein
MTQTDNLHQNIQGLGYRVESLTLAQAHFILKFLGTTGAINEIRIIEAIKLTQSLGWLK